jgi:ribosomal protein L37AE/L43A
MVRDAMHQQHPDVGRWPAERMAEAAPALFWQAPVPLQLNAATAPSTESVEVYVNEGRWVVECPDCHSAQFAARDDHRFLCHECANVAVGGLWRPVVWPSKNAVGDIEAALDKRKPVNANWLPGETPAMLQAENAAHGIGD